jgi:glycosyltransferase involved in cell wall biosynthesis
MKIAQLTPYFHPHIGGVESYVLALSKELMKKRHDVTVYTTLLPNTKENENIEGVNVKRIKPLFTLLKTPVTPSLKISGYDIVHAHSPPPFHSYFAARFCKKNKIPFVLTYHCDPEIPSFLGRLISAMYMRTFGIYALKNADRIIVSTKTYAATSRAMWNYEPAVIPSAVDIKEFNPNVDGNDIREKYNLDGNVVLFVGRLVEHKGLEYLIRSARSVDAKYLIVGEGELRRKFEEEVKNLGLSDKIIFTGKVSSTELPKYYAASNVFVLPSVARLEAFGLVIAEAMSCGKPVIVSDIPGVRELITDNVEGVLVPPMDEKVLSEKINILLSNPEMRKRMGESGRKKVEEKFSWERVIGEIEKVYEEVVSR